MTQLLILLNFWGTPFASALVIVVSLYIIMILGGKLIRNHISPSLGKAIIGFGYILIILAIGVAIFTD